MTDHIPADKVEKIAAEMRDAMRREEDGYLYADFLSDMSDYIRDLESLLPAPPRPTLADMTEEERVECQWMQADVKDDDTRAVIVSPCWGDGTARVMWPGGFNEPTDWEKVTPRPDLPRLEWPGTEKPAPALPDGWRLADHRDHGRVIVTTPEPDSGGKVAFVRQNNFWDRKYSGDWCKPDELAYLDQEGDQ